MISNILIEQTQNLPPDLDTELLPESVREGFDHVKWLQQDWQSEKNQFSMPEEAFYVVSSDSRLIGVCGVNFDPYSKDDSVCRRRRLYVHPGFRGKGVGRSLVERAIADARKHFKTIRLRTLDDQAASFFEALGFRELVDQEGATHEMVLNASK